MTAKIQLQAREEIRKAIGYNLGCIIVSTAKSTVDTSSLIDTYGLQRGGDSDYIGSQVIIYSATGSIVDGEKSWVTAFDSSTKDATCTPVFTESIATGDAYELWRPPFTVEDVNDAINEAIMDITDSCLQVKETETNYTAIRIPETFMPKFSQQQANTDPALSSLLWRLWCHLSRRRQLQFGLMLVLMLVSAFAEMASLGAVIPFLGVLIAPDRVFSHPAIASSAKFFGITSAAELLS